jgi:lysyl-tRNA synthetase class 2
MSRLDETIQAKKEKRAKLEEQGVIAHPYSFDSTHTVAQARTSMDQEVTTAGRIMALRLHGKLAFADIKDTTDQIQVMLREDAIGSEAFDQLSLVDSGDFIGVTGTVGVSKTGEVTIVASEYTFLGKALRPLPTAWNAAEDKEARFRKRYLDMLINPVVKRVLDARW